MNQPLQWKYSKKPRWWRLHWTLWLCKLRRETSTYVDRMSKTSFDFLQIDRVIAHITATMPAWNVGSLRIHQIANGIKCTLKAFFFCTVYCCLAFEKVMRKLRKSPTNVSPFVPRNLNKLNYEFDQGEREKRIAPSGHFTSRNFPRVNFSKMHSTARDSHSGHGQEEDLPL